MVRHISHLLAFFKTGLFKSSLVYLAITAVSAGAPLLLLPILTRVLTPEEYGNIAMFSVMVQIFGISVGLSTHGAVGIKYFDRDEIDFPRFVGSCLIVLLTSTAVTLLAVASFSGPLEQFMEMPSNWLLIAVVFSACIFIVQIQISIWQSGKEPYKFAGLRLFQGSADLCGSLILVLVVGLGWQGRLSGMVLAGIAAAGISLLTMSRGNWVRLPNDSSYIRLALNFGVPLIPHAAGSMLLMTSDRLLITNLLGVSATGIYLATSQLGMILYLANEALSRAYSPLLFEKLKLQNGDTDRNIVRYTYAYFAAILATAIAFGTLTPFILSAIAGPSFQEAGQILIFIAIGQAFGGMYLTVSTYIFFSGRTAYLAMVTIPVGIANVGITYWLIKRGGLIGAAQGFMVTQLLFFLGTWALSQRCRPMPWFSAVAIDPLLYAKSAVIGFGMTTYAALFIPPERWTFIGRPSQQAAHHVGELIEAAREGNIPLMRQLLVHGADVNAANSLGVTPLIAAAASLQRPAIEFLLSRGANRKHKTLEGFTAYDFSKNQLDHDLARLLIY